MYGLQESDLIVCDECSFLIVCGDECINGIETLCADCYSKEYAEEQDQTALCLQMEQQS